MTPCTTRPLRTTLELASALCAALALATAPSPAWAATPLFDAPYISYETAVWPEGLDPYSAVVADFDGDGVADLATTSFGGSAYLSVLLADGECGYRLPAVTIDIGLQSVDLVAGDFDGDGDNDIVLTDTDLFFAGTTVSTYKNDGAGNFTYFSSSDTGTTGPAGITAADFDGDGLLDVAVAHDAYIVSGNSMAVLINDGSGSFGLGQLTTMASGTREIVSGDLDGDGDVDAIVAHEANLFSVMLNDGGTLAVTAQVTGLDGWVPELPDATLVDFDLDGDLDVFYSHFGTGGFAEGQIGFWRNRGDATFDAPEVIDFDYYSNGGVGLTSADVTGDGWPDLLAATDNTHHWFLVAGDGAGGFTPPERFRSGDTPFRIVTPDLDGDGDLEVVVVARESMGASVYMNPGDGAFVQPDPIDMTPVSLSPAFPTNLAAGDIDGDDDLDLVLGYRSDFQSQDGISVRRNLGDRTFGPIEDYIEGVHPLSVRLDDIDLDGDLDLVWLSSSADLRGRLNDGAGQFGASLILRSVPGAEYMALFDIEGDGDRDAVFARGFFVDVCLNDGSGAFGAPIATNLGPFVTVVGMGDFNGDGDLDLLTNSSFDHLARISIGNGDGTFDAANVFITGPIFRAFATGDLDDDGDLDVAAIYNDEDKGITVARGDGTGGFFPQTATHGSYGTVEQTSSLAMVDADGDGHLDAMSANFSAQDVSFWRGRGDGTLEPLMRYGVGEQAFDLAPGDFDGDGLLDVAVATQTDSGEWFHTGVVILRGKPAAPAFVLSQTPMQRGMPVTWTATGAAPGEQVVFLSTATGIGDGPCLPQLGGLCLDLLPPLRVQGRAVADANGTASITRTLPAGVPVGRTFYSQAAVRRGEASMRSNTTQETITP